MAADSTAPLLPPHRALEVGDVIDGFRLDERIHQGGMAQLWRVTALGSQADPGLPLIMKVPRIKGGDDPATIVGFEVEQMILPTLRGPHVPRFVAHGDFTQQPYIVMERIDGESVRPRFDAAPLAPDEVAAIGAKVALALHELHRQHVIHLDVNGTKRQSSTLGKLIWSVPEIIEHISAAWELAPGDLIFSGTPEGVAAVEIGDTLEGRIDGVGSLKVQVVE